MGLHRGRRGMVERTGASRPKPEQIEFLAADSEPRMGNVLEESLQESERRYRLLAENVTDVIWTADMNLNLTYVSPSVTHMLGYSVEEVMAPTLEEVLTPPSLELAMKTVAEELAMEEMEQKDLSRSRTLELEINCKDGSTVWTEAKMTFLRDSDTQPVGIVGVLRDITERKRADEALRESEEKYRSVVESVSDLIFTADVEGKVLFANPLAKNFTGYEAEETIGHNFTEYVHPDDAPSLFAGIQQALSGESTESITGVDEDLEFRMVKQDGEVIWVAGRSRPNRDREGKIVGFSGVLRDITERKRAEEELRESEAKYREIASNIPGVVYQFTLSKDGSTSFPFISEVCNAVFGLTPEEIKSDPSLPFRMIVADDFDRINQLLAESVQAMENGTAEFRIKTRTGETKWLRASASPHLLPDGGILWDGIILDITERKQAEEETAKIQAQLLQAQKMEAIGLLAGGIAHDFNNLLTAIQGYADMAMMETDETDPLYRNLKGIDAACSRAARLTGQLLLFSRKNSVEVTPLDINGILKDLLNMLNRLIAEDIAINTYLEPDIFTIRADPGSIEQVIMNLAVNARDAMPEGGKLTITTENVTLSKEQCKAIPEARPGTYVCLSVADTEVGMDEEIIPYIFEPFFTTKEPGEGSGLGLSVVYGIARQHEGWIDVYSEPGQGSMFKLYLPAVPVKAEAKTKGTILEQQLQGNGERILVVEDEERVREFLVDMLSEKGHAVYEAASAKEALDIFDSEKGNFHLVFSDVLLPDMSGFELVDQLLSRKPELPVLLGSGWVDNKLKWPTIREKGFQLLQKPYDLAELLQAVKEAMGTCL